MTESSSSFRPTYAYSALVTFDLVGELSKLYKVIRLTEIRMLLASSYVGSVILFTFSYRSFMSSLLPSLEVSIAYERGDYFSLSNDLSDLATKKSKFGFVEGIILSVSPATMSTSVAEILC